MSKYQTCAHSAPWQPPIPLDDEEKGYPVGRFCKHACRSMAVIRDPEVCESCTQYTDPAKLITINTGDYHADIYFDRLEDMPLSNIRKVFKLLLADPWSNEGAIRQMTLYLDAAVIESKEAWKQASIEYQNGWRNVFNKKSRLKEDRQKLRENNRLTAAVKRTKARHERWVKLQTCWAEAQPDANTRVQFNCKGDQKIMYQNDAMKVLTGEVRLSYANLTTPRAAQQGGEPKYSVTLLIPKSDAATKADIDAAIQAAANEAMAKVWNGARPPMLKVPIYDGDGVRPSGVPFGDECKGHWVMTASTKNKPQVVGIDNINCELSPADIYSGMYGRVTVRFFGYSNSGNKGIGCGLGNVLKTRDGEPLSGQASAASDFAGLGGTPAATPTYGAAMPATPGAYGVQPAAPAAPAAQVPWATTGGINPITGQPM